MARHHETLEQTLEADAHHSPEPFYMEPVFWVAVAFIVFMALALRPLAKVITRALDAKSVQIAAELAEARRLRAEAQDMLDAYQKKQRESLQEAEDMLARTRSDAARILEKAEADVKANMEKRLKLATDKIAQAESRALQDMQGYVADIALEASRTLIARQLEKGGDDALIHQAAADIASKIH